MTPTPAAVRETARQWLADDRTYPAEDIRQTRTDGAWKEAIAIALEEAPVIAFEAGTYVANASVDADLFLEIWLAPTGPDAGGYKSSRHGARSDKDWRSPLFSCPIPQDLVPQFLPRDLETRTADASDAASAHWSWATTELCAFEAAVLSEIPSDRVEILRRSSFPLCGTPWRNRFPGLPGGHEYFYRVDQPLFEAVARRTELEIEAFAILPAQHATTACRLARTGVARAPEDAGSHGEILSVLRAIAQASADIRKLTGPTRVAGSAPLGNALPPRQRGLL